MIVSDDQTVDSIAAMPFLKSKPGGHWFEFPNGYLNTPLCCPTRATLFTGLYSHHHGVTVNNGGLFNDHSTIATWLHGAGYRTGLAGKYLNDYPFGGQLVTPPGWDDWFADIKASGYYGYQMNDNGTAVSYGGAESDYQPDVVAGRADAFIRSTPQDKPLFMYAAPIGPHAPLIPPVRYANAPVTLPPHTPNFNELDVSDKPAWVQGKPLLTKAQVTSMDKDRVKEFKIVMSVDDLVKKVYQALSDTGRLDNTMIVFMTDNGFLFGEHRLSNKSCVYRECVGTPYFVRYPLAPGRVDPHLMSSIDIAPTFADLAGIVPPDAVDGTSMIPLLKDPNAAWRTSMLHEFADPQSDRPPFWAVRTIPWKYAELSTGEKELYDMVNDPYELQNVANQAQYAAIQADLASQLAVLKTEPAHMVLPSVSIGDAAATEGTSTTSQAEFRLTLSNSSSTPTSVRATTADGSATAPNDYQNTVQTVTFNPGETSKTFSVPLTPDAVVEPDETFTVTLDQPQGLVIADGSATGTILDDDSPPALSVGDVSVAEGNSGTTPATFAVSLSHPSPDPVTVSYATADGTAMAPSDYAYTSGQLTFSPGDVSKTVTVSVVGDTSVEPDETFSLELSSPAGATIADGTGVGTIATDDVVRTASISDASVSEGNIGSAPATFTVTLSPPAAGPVVVSWATADGTATTPSDYQGASGIVSFQAGESSKPISVLVNGDSTYEAAETFSVNIASVDVAIGDGQGTGTIGNDDALPSLSINDIVITEGNSGTSPATMTVKLSTASGLPVTVNWATADLKAKAPSDYIAASGSLTFAPGETTKTIQVSIVGDTVAEKDEIFNVKLSGASGATIADNSGNCNIKNDD